MSYQQGVLPLVSGVNEYSINFSSAFSAPPEHIYPVVFDSAEEPVQDWIHAVVTSRTTTSFTVELTTAPTTDTYRLSWTAGDEVVVVNPAGTGQGIPISNLPDYTAPKIPGNAYIPIVIPGSQLRTYRIAYFRLNDGVGHTHTSAQITDTTALGRKVMTASTAASARAALGAAATVHTHLIADISNATALGKSLLAAINAADARSIVGAAATSHTHTADALTDATALGKSFIRATDVAALQAALQAAPAVHTHVLNDITDASTLGKQVAAATTAAAMRALMEAGDLKDWISATLPVGANTLDNTYVSKKFTLTGNSSLTIAPTNYTVTDIKTAFYVPPGSTLTVTGSGGAVFRTPRGTAITSPLSLTNGLFIFQQIGSNIWFLDSFGATGAQLVDAATPAAAKTILNIQGADITDSGAMGRSILAASNAASVLSLLGIDGTDKVISTLGTGSTVALSTGFTGSPNNYLFVAGTAGTQTINVDSIGTIGAGQSFYIYAKTADVMISVTSPIRLNNGSDYGPPFLIREGTLAQFSYIGMSGSNQDLLGDFPYIPASSSIAYVASVGNDTTGTIGRSDLPFATIKAAVTAGGSTSNVFVTPGIYDEVGHIGGTGSTHIHCLPGVTIRNASSSQYLFDSTVSGSSNTAVLTGNADIVIQTARAGLIYYANNTNTTSVTVNAINKASSSAPLIYMDAAITYPAEKCSLFANTIINSSSQPIVRVNSAGVVFVKATSITSSASPFSYGNNGTLDIAPLGTRLDITLDGVGATTKLVEYATPSVAATTYVYATNISNTNASNTAFLLTVPSANSKLYISAVRLRAANSKAISHVAGVTELRGTSMYGKIQISSSGLRLKDCEQIASGASDALTSTSGVNTLVVLGTLTSDSDPDYANVDFLGGNIIVDTTLTHD